jgi:ribosomal protein S18 acetylase RimI-like enzyme
VHPRARGQGFGRRLVYRCVDNARRVGAAAVGTHSAASMERACGMYERVGFVRCPKYDIYSVLGFDRSLGDEMVIAYVLPLTGTRLANREQRSADIRLAFEACELRRHDRREECVKVARGTA